MYAVPESESVRFSDAGMRDSPRTPAAGIRKAPRCEIAAAGNALAAPRAMRSLPGLDSADSGVAASRQLSSGESCRNLIRTMLGPCVDGSGLARTFFTRAAGGRCSHVFGLLVRFT